MRHLTNSALSLVALAAMLAPLPAAADEITDALNAAIQEYEAGEIDDALDEIAYATQLLNALQAQGLGAFLPEPLEGWTMEVSDEMTSSLGFIGGGIAAEGIYTGPSGNFTILLMADNPMVAQMGAMLSNTAVMRTMGQIERINRETFLLSDGDLSALIGNRVLVQATGGDIDDMIAHLEQIDFGDLEDFDD